MLITVGREHYFQIPDAGSITLPNMMSDSDWIRISALHNNLGDAVLPAVHVTGDDMYLIHKGAGNSLTLVRHWMHG
jgi:hypothetical protein